MLRFKIFGFPVTVHWMFWLIMVLIFSNIGGGSAEGFRLVVVAVALGFVSILGHELGHAWFQRKYGGNPQIMLHGMGGVAISQGMFTRNQSLVITGAGPAVSLILAGIGYVALRAVPFQNDYLVFAFWILFIMNLTWGIFNLLPVLPMDGGRLLEHFMHGRNSRLRGQIGFGVAVAGALYFLSRSNIMGAVVLGYFAYFNWNYSQGKAMPRMY